jgi:opacity protein-like surface antigen
MIFLCNVNNSISHPPHPRRAVPANLPPGAFFFFRVFSIWALFLFFCMVVKSLSAATVEGDNLSRRILDLRMKSHAHGKFVSELLGNPIDFEPIKPGLNSSPSLPPSTSVEDIPLPSPESLSQPPGAPSTVIPAVEEEIAIHNQKPHPIEDRSPSASSQEVVFINQPPLPAKTSQTYEELYKPKVPQRRLGYYFGPFVGLVFPDDGAVRYPKESFKSDGGITGGLRLGHDFGSIRVEGEYAFLTHKISHGRTKLHNFQSRFILEKSVGSRADFRGGIGMGLGVVNHDYMGHEFKGAGFSYDFLLGWSYRVMENWSLNMDYRHYLTAAHENYDRLQGHIIELSAGFDL